MTKIEPQILAIHESLCVIVREHPSLEHEVLTLYRNIEGILKYLLAEKTTYLDKQEQNLDEKKRMIQAMEKAINTINIIDEDREGWCAIVYVM